MFLMRSHHIKEVRAFRFNHFDKGFIKIFWIGDAPGTYSETLGNSYKVRVGGLIKPSAQISMATITFEEAIFPLNHHAEVLIV